ncbi:hypothetical protein HDV00_009478 [Rhizophlyctis rosea]|nr:hypothetical protein HDV00_009478 [Rhizophlyctis rosea]
MSAAVLSRFAPLPHSEQASDARGQQVALEEALRQIRDFLSHVGHNAANGDVHSATLGLICLGEPPRQTQRVAQATPNSPVAEVLHKMRTARRARDQRRAGRADSAVSMEQSERSGAERDATKGLPEVFSTGAKSFKHRDLRQQVLLKVWDQARLRRWWEWHDRQMADLKALQTVRRRQFLSNLRQHPWVTKSSEPTQVLTRPSDEEVRRLRRVHLLTKLRTSPDALDPVPPPTPAELSPEQRQANLLKRKESLSKLRRTTPPPSSPKSPLSPRSPFSASLSSPLATATPTIPTFRIRTPEEHRKSQTAANSGSLRSKQADYWSRWAAMETLNEQREIVRESIESLLYHTPVPANLSHRLRAKHMWLDDDVAW